jgi:glycosyltransferase involved in cell wall biosynthesis
MQAMRVQIVDPSGYVTPYDHALSGALAAEGLDVELLTTRFLYGPTPEPDGYRVTEAFYRRAAGRGLDAWRSRRALKLLEHLPDMLRYRRHAADADVRHYQWLPLEPLDTLLLPPARPRVMTMHNVLRRGTRPGRLAVTRRLAERMDAVVVHSRHSARQLEEAVGFDGDRVRVIPHGAFDYLTRQPEELPLPEELAAVDGPVVMSFGMVRPYKGTDVLLEAFRRIEGAELWIVGMPLHTPMESLHELARQVPGRVRFVTRYVSDPELPAYFRRADLLALPYRQVDQSGVLYCGLAFGKAMVMSAVGGFVEVAEDHGAARLVPPGDAAALAEAVSGLLADPIERRRLEAAATAAGRGEFSWPSIAARTAELYRELTS